PAGDVASEIGGDAVLNVERLVVVERRVVERDARALAPRQGQAIGDVIQSVVGHFKSSPCRSQALSDRLTGRERLDGERVNPISKEVAESIVHDAVPLEAASAFKFRRHDKQPKMAL